jgi:hypothetical protein
VANEFLDPNDGSSYGTQEGDEFKFVFVNGYILEGSTDSNTNDGVIYLTDPQGNTVELPFDGTKNEITFTPPDPPGGEPFTMHLSCSDRFIGGWGQSDGPTEEDNGDWQISSWSILRYRSGGTFFKGCGDVVVPYDLTNTAYADGTDSNSDLGTDELVSDTATLQIVRQIKIVNLEDQNQTGKGRKIAVALRNTGLDDLALTNVKIEWAGATLTEVLLGSDTIWTGTKEPPMYEFSPAPAPVLVPNQTEKIQFFFAKKPVGPYIVTLTFEGPVTTEILVVNLD